VSQGFLGLSSRGGGDVGFGAGGGVVQRLLGVGFAILL
jgi:hypothetical protein